MFWITHLLCEETSLFDWKRNKNTHILKENAPPPEERKQKFMCSHAHGVKRILCLYFVHHETTNVTSSQFKLKMFLCDWNVKWIQSPESDSRKTNKHQKVCEFDNSARNLTFYVRRTKDENHPDTNKLTKIHKNWWEMRHTTKKQRSSHQTCHTQIFLRKVNNHPLPSEGKPSREEYRNLLLNPKFEFPDFEVL